MNPTIKIFSLLLFGWTFSFNTFAQEVLTVTTDILSSKEQLILDEADNWLFQKGNNPAWAAKNLDVSTWKKFKPTDLSITDADETGRVEGWFRIKIKIAPSLKDKPLYFNKRTRDAANIYLDGKLIKSYGKIAPSRATYNNSIDNGLLPIPISLQVDSIYTIAIHILDYTVMYPPRLASAISGPHIFFEIVGQKYYDARIVYWKYNPIFRTFWVTTCGLLTLFFWYLVYLNPSEKSLRLIAICVSLGTFSALGFSLFEAIGITFSQWRIYFSATLIGVFAYLSYMIRVVAKIFIGSIPRNINLLTIGIFVVGFLNVFITLNIIPMIGIILLTFITCSYLLIKYWTTLKGAQWAFVVGIISTIFFLMVLVVLAFLNDYRHVGISPQIMETITTFGFLSLPISMLVYTALRFKEINTEVQTKAYEVVRISEEKAIQLQKINTASAKFVPSTFLNFLGKENILDATLGDYVEKQVSVLFSDIRDYTTLSEQMTPEENFRFVNAYNRRMGPIIQKHQGFVNQYLGDGLMAIFPENTSATLKAAIAMQQTLQEYNHTRIAKTKIPIRMGIGIHAGPLIMGIIGDDQRMDAATISDTVNAASRVEGLTKHFGANILLSEAVVDNLPNRDAFNLRYLGLVQVKGKQEVIKIYECFDGNAEEMIALKKVTKLEFEEGMKYYYTKNFDQGLEAFAKVLKLNPKDGTAQFFINKLKGLKQQELDEDWTGVELMVNK